MRAGLPFVLPTFVLGISFGVLAQPVMGSVAPVVMSVFVFSGAAQFAALSVLAAGGGVAAAIAAGHADERALAADGARRRAVAARAARCGAIVRRPGDRRRLVRARQPRRRHASTAAC